MKKTLLAILLVLVLCLPTFVGCDTSETPKQTEEKSSGDVVEQDTTTDDGNKGEDKNKDYSEIYKDPYDVYEELTNKGYTGTFEEWVESLKGADGADGKSAYQLAVENGYTGTVEEWLLSLVGAPGKDGADGKDGVDGAPGKDGEDGEDGKDGLDGKSVYDLAVENGFKGTLEDWLLSLVGADGKDGVDGAPGKDGEDGKDGDKGDKGDKGDTGATGNGILTIIKSGSDGLVDTYTIVFTDGRTTTFTVTNGAQGPQGPQGPQGEKGEDGKDGVDGEDGKDGADGAPGKDGEDGADGLTPYIGENGNWWIGDKDTGIKAEGKDGADGADGADGKDGADGEKGDSGATIEKVEFDEQGRLVITLTDGTVLDPVELPKEDEHIHSFGTTIDYVANATLPCQQRIYFQVCTTCNSVQLIMGTEDDHVFSNELYGNETQHWSQCEKCGFYKDISDHSCSDPYYSNDLYHWRICDICGLNEKYSAHVWSKTYELVDNQYHWKKCNTCSKQIKEKHHYVDGFCDRCGLMSGPWSVYTIKSQYFDGYAAVMHDIPGYEYTEDGLRMIPGKWADSTPYATIQTTEPVNLKEGVYLQVRVDQFSYDAGDKWFGFSIWDQQNVELGKQGDDYGYGVETLIRIKNGVNNYDEADQNTWAGAMGSLEWYKDLEEGQRISCPNAANNKLYVNEFDENGCPILTLEIIWDSDSEAYAISINGAPAPDAYNQAATDYFAELDDQAYVGFSLQNNTRAGTLGCTILKYGTSAEDATTPTGTDSAEPEEFLNQVAPIADPSEVPEGEPAIVLNGSRSGSDVKGKPASVLGNIIVVNPDSSVNILANSDNMANAKFIVDNEVSYDTKDFPYVLMITRNFCSCTYTDSDLDGVPEEYCTCTESVNMLALAGNIVQESSSYAAKSAPLSYWEPTYVGDDFYHYFVFDWSSIAGLKGRINGLRVDVAGMKGSDAERNNFDIVELAFFRTEKEAMEYFQNYIERLG